VAEREDEADRDWSQELAVRGLLKGGKTAAVLMSFNVTCSRLGVEPGRISKTC